MRTALIRDLFSYGFPRKLRAGPYGSYDNNLLLTEPARAVLGKRAYWPEVVTEQTERSEVPTKPTEGQYFPLSYDLYGPARNFLGKP